MRDETHDKGIKNRFRLYGGYRRRWICFRARNFTVFYEFWNARNDWSSRFNSIIRVFRNDFNEYRKQIKGRVQEGWNLRNKWKMDRGNCRGSDNIYTIGCWSGYDCRGRFYVKSAF